MHEHQATSRPETALPSPIGDRNEEVAKLQPADQEAMGEVVEALRSLARASMAREPREAHHRRLEDALLGLTTDGRRVALGWLKHQMRVG